MRGLVAGCRVVFILFYSEGRGDDAVRWKGRGARGGSAYDKICENVLFIVIH